MFSKTEFSDFPGNLRLGRGAWLLHIFLYYHAYWDFDYFGQMLRKKQKLCPSKSFTRQKELFLACKHCIEVTYTPFEFFITLSYLWKNNVFKNWIFGFSGKSWLFLPDLMRWGDRSLLSHHAEKTRHTLVTKYFYWRLRMLWGQTICSGCLTDPIINSSNT